MASQTLPLPHIAIFPFMAKGHTIPLLHLSHLIHRRGLATLTFFTTPLNAPFIRSSLADIDADVVVLPFPQSAPNLPPGVESTDGLPSMALFVPFIAALKQLQPQFELALESLPKASFLITDVFLSWTKDSASELGIPRVVFTSMGNFAMTTAHSILFQDGSAISGFLGARITIADLCRTLGDLTPYLPMFEFIKEEMRAARESHGIIANSFYELEGAYCDQWNSKFGPKSWSLGPLCLAKKKTERSAVMEWLHSRSTVLYLAFGTQAELPVAQLQEIAIGLERSGLDFIWVVREKGVDLGDGFEERVGERGWVVREWVDQMEILRHESVKGFVSHCGWNSVMEAISAGVPILTWPTMAEQQLNAMFVVEELQVGLRVPASGGTGDGLVRGEDVERAVRELLVGEEGRKASEKAKEVAEAARKAMDRGGSSWCALEMMMDEVCGCKKELKHNI